MIRTPLRQRKRLISRQSPAFLALGLLGVAAGIPSQANAQATYTLKATPKTVAWGYYDAKATPTLRIKSGDTVEIDTLITNSPKRLEETEPPQTTEQPLIYVKHLEQPARYPPLARQIQVQGTIVVKLAIATDGTVQSAEALTREQDPEANGHPLLRDETLKLVRKWTFGCAYCSSTAPYEKTIKFTYRLEGEGIPYDNTTVVMDLPDQITITASPSECDHCPRKKTSHGGAK